jgi:hypothetical protein
LRQNYSGALQERFALDQHNRNNRLNWSIAQTAFLFVP